MSKNDNIEENTSKNDSQINSFIETHWKDLHHSRSQDWQYWLIIGGIIAGIGTLYKEGGKNATPLIYVLVGIGGFVSIWATLISYSHWVLHIKKMCYIDYLESFVYKNGILNYHSFLNTLEVNLEEKKKINDPFKVGGLIFAIHATVSILFLFASIIIAFKDFLKSIFHISGIMINLIPIASLVFSVIVLFIIYFKFKNCLEKKRDEYYDTIVHKMKSNMDESFYKLHFEKL